MTELAAWVRRERAVLWVLAVSSVLHAVAWGATSRPMGDTADYRLAARVVFSGWDQLTERTPGYPLVLWLTGSTRHDTWLLFLTQLVFHLVAVLLVVDLARRVGVGSRGRLAIAVLLVMPPVMMKVVYAGSEATTEVVVTLVVWLAWRWADDRRLAWLVPLGLTVGVAAMVRPTFQLLVLPLGALVWWWSRGERPVRAVAIAVLPAIVLVGSLVTYNGARFDSYGLTPLLPWHLSSKVSLFVEDLPESEEPARSYLIERRDELLLRDPTRNASTFAFDNRPGLAAVTGIEQGPELDRYMLGLDLQLIARRPLDYLQAVANASVRYVRFDEEKAGFGDHAAVGRLWTLVHGLLALAVAVLVLLTPGVLLARGIDRRRGRLLLLGSTLVVYTAAVSVAMETGSARLRAPTDPLIVLLAVVAFGYLRNELGHPTRRVDP